MCLEVCPDYDVFLVSLWSCCLVAETVMVHHIPALRKNISHRYSLFHMYLYDDCPIPIVDREICVLGFYTIFVIPGT